MEKGHSMEVSRFGLEFNPFLKNSKEILVETAQYREALFRLSYLAKTKGFGLLTGGPGRGKATAVRNWAAALNLSLYKVVYSCLSTLTVSDFYRSLVESKKQNEKKRKAENHHKYIMGGIVVKYFPDCYRYDEGELNRILSVALQTRECQQIISKIKAESRETTPPTNRSHPCRK